MTKYLIVGLGNVGEEYANTRHNIGFDVVDYIATQQKLEWKLDRLAYITNYKLKGRQIFLIKPTTYMNRSGDAVKYWMQKEKIGVENILVVVDDLALPLEKFRVRETGSDAGHNGLKDIQNVLATTQYPRLRFGIGNQYAKGQQVDFVLGKWKNEEVPIIAKKIELSSTIIEKFVLEGINSVMNFSNNINISI